MTKIIAVIPARYASSRFPGKPLALIAGVSMIQRCYENTRKCNRFDQVIVATDDQRIFDHVTSFGAPGKSTPVSWSLQSPRMFVPTWRHTRTRTDSAMLIQSQPPCRQPSAAAITAICTTDGGNASIRVASTQSRILFRFTGTAPCPTRRALPRIPAAVPEASASRPRRGCRR